MKFTVHIIPRAQKRARHSTRSGHTYKDKGQRQAETELRALLEPHRPAEPLAGPLALLVKAYLPIPPSWPEKKKQQARLGGITPTGRPDLDNLLKHIKDCLSPLREKRAVILSGFWLDDSQVVEYLPGTGKYYDDGQGPRWEIEINEYQTKN